MRSHFYVAPHPIMLCNRNNTGLRQFLPGYVNLLRSDALSPLPTHRPYSEGICVLALLFFPCVASPFRFIYSPIPPRRGPLARRSILSLQAWQQQIARWPPRTQRAEAMAARGFHRWHWLQKTCGWSGIGGGGFAVMGAPQIGPSPRPRPMPVPSDRRPQSGRDQGTAPAAYPGTPRCWWRIPSTSESD